MTIVARVRGLLEFLGILIFGVALGAFLMSLFVPQSDPDNRDPARPGVPGPAIDRALVQIEVRNGSGLSGAAGEVTSRLRDEGFDVVDYGNADHFAYQKTQVIDRVGDRRRAMEVASVMGLDDVQAEPDSSLLLDVTVILGRDRIWEPQPVAPDTSPLGRLWSRVRRIP